MLHRQELAAAEIAQLLISKSEDKGSLIFASESPRAINFVDQGLVTLVFFTFDQWAKAYSEQISSDLMMDEYIRWMEFYRDLVGTIESRGHDYVVVKGDCGMANGDAASRMTALRRADRLGAFYAEVNDGEMASNMQFEAVLGVLQIFETEDLGYIYSVLQTFDYEGREIGQVNLYMVRNEEEVDLFDFAQELANDLGVILFLCEFEGVGPYSKDENMLLPIQEDIHEHAFRIDNDHYDFH